MPTVKGRSEVSRYIRNIPEMVEKHLKGAVREAANVIAEEARNRSESDQVSDGIKVSVSVEDDRIIGKISIKGGKMLQGKANWLEYGTLPHFITVDDEQRQGKTARRINTLDNEARASGRIGKADSLTINGQFVGKTVFHPGARAHPFLRPALDAKEAEAVAAAQRYLNERLGKAGGPSNAPAEDN